MKYKYNHMPEYGGHEISIVDLVQLCADAGISVPRHPLFNKSNIIRVGSYPIVVTPIDIMSGIARDKLRTKATGEIFTPTPLVQEILDHLDQDLFNDKTKTFLDPSCGDGQFLSEVLIRKLENSIDFETALSTIYGVDLMPDNVQLCRDRLLCGQEHLRHIVEKNIVCHDALTYNYCFGEPETFGTDGLFTFD